MKSSLPLVAAIAATCLVSPASEPRTWTDTKGRTLEGTLAKQNDTTVWVRRTNGTRVAIQKSTLSEEDLEHLKKAAKARASLKGERFDTSRIDPTAWKPRATGLRFGKLVYPVTLETPHFIIGAEPKVREATLSSYGEAAQRLWTDLASDYPALAVSFKDRKLPVVLVDGNDQAKKFASWHQEHARESSTVGYSFNLATYTIAAFSLDKEFAKENGLAEAGRLFRLDSKEADHNRTRWPQRIHFLTDDILRQWTGRPKNNGDCSISMLRLALSYHREEQICGKIESEVSFGGGSEVEGFRNGRNWSGATKKLLKSGARPDIESFLEIPGSKAQPRDLGFGLGLIHFIHDDDDRLAGFGKLLATVAEDQKCADADEFAKALGFDSPGELDAAWGDYMTSDAYE